ncbi:antibiotic ABC transporter ATP-binding protein [Streptomyces sp. NPDC002896]|uniref:antibiotic ABC transporter ATP-binding protein n=1 Tax=Streptomyces sp. NPDC002896 TaxID=3154438 RepID=UPI003316D978
MARVIFVHGVGQQFSGALQVLAAVGPALRDGVQLGAGLALRDQDVACAFYGDVFFEPGTRSMDVPWWDETDVEGGLEAELLEAWWGQAARVDLEVAGPDEAGVRGPVGYGASRLLLSDRVRAALDALSRASFFAHVSEPLLIFALKQVRRYMTELELQQAAQARLAEVVTEETRVVVGHSLGSVVAYEALCAHPEWPVTDFVTLGSPLGMRSVVFDRLRPPPVNGVGGWPGGVVRWTNVADRGDIVALAHRLASRFGSRVEDISISNGMRMHAVERYLGAARTGVAVAKGLGA